ncbi:MAG TPA: hypothetical protein VM736_04430 [Gemmatimonadales bacterium]|nr:hypothetical protein [Gemmatimonadales bacterium]
MAMLTAAIFASACVTWQTQALQPDRLRQPDSTQTLRLSLTNGDTVMVRSPVVRGDTLYGVAARSGAPDSLDHPVSVAIDAISQVEVQKDNAPAVALGIIAFGALLAAVAASLPCMGWCSQH